MIIKIETSTAFKTLFHISAPWQWKEFIKKNPEQAGGKPSSEVLTEELLFDSRRVNLAVNTLFYTKDKKELWQIAKEFGDCEDLMLAKRAKLHEFGYSLGALRPIICQTEQKIWHAVLCLVTDLGDYILDNRYSMLMPWERLPYHWDFRWAGKDWEILLNG